MIVLTNQMHPVDAFTNPPHRDPKKDITVLMSDARDTLERTRLTFPLRGFGDTEARTRLPAKSPSALPLA